MEIRNACRWSDAGIKGYAVATLGIIAACGLNYGMHALVADSFSLMSCTLVAIVITCFYGIGVGIYTILLGFPIGFYLFVPPYNSFGAPTRHDFFMILMNLTVLIVCMFLFERLRRAQYATNLMSKVADSRYRLLVESDQELFKVRRSMEKYGQGLSQFKHEAGTDQ
jgi:K+-sensing histidine kinase KdpD